MARILMRVGAVFLYELVSKKLHGRMVGKHTGWEHKLLRDLKDLTEFV
jgi:hypothetical protein